MRDDRLHKTLAKARSLDQTRIDALDAGAGRATYGQTIVQELDTPHALSVFTGARGPAWSLNPYVGCAHRCAYCYVPDTLHAERHRWGQYVIVKRNLLAALARDLRTRTPATTYLSTSTDPYQPVEAEHRLTRGSLRMLADAGWPVDVLTRSPLILRDLDVLADVDTLRVGLSVPTLDDGVRAILEPGAPPIDARLKALAELADAGFTTYANYSPAHPWTGGYGPGDLAATFADVGVQWIHVSGWHRQRTVLPVVRGRLAQAGSEGLVPLMTDGAQEALHRDIEAAMTRVGIRVEHGFFNPPHPRPAPTPAPQGRLADAVSVDA